MWGSLNAERSLWLDVALIARRIDEPGMFRLCSGLSLERLHDPALPA